VRLNKKKKEKKKRKEKKKKKKRQKKEKKTCSTDLGHVDAATSMVIGGSCSKGGEKVMA